MRTFGVLGIISVCALMATPAWAADMPDAVAAMIRAAAETGDAATLKTTVDLARKTNPAATAEIDALVAEIEKTAEDARVAKLKHQGILEGWKGQGQAGASISTGNTQNKGLALGLNLNRDGLKWRHTILATVDYARDQGVTTKQRYYASYEANYKFNDRLYVLGLGSWERDRFAGFDRRFSETVGVGYSVIRTPEMTLNVEAGPALRQTRYITGLSENKFAARTAADYAWTIAPGMLFTENATYYGQSGDATITSTTALTFKLRGALSVQASFLATHETNPPLGLDKTDTTSRMTLVYGF